MKKTTLTLFALTTALLLSPAPASAAEEKPAAKPAPEIELGAPFCDHAVLQREMHLPVWGWSQPGTTLTVEFAGQKETTKADADGKWLLKLKPLKANAEPAEMLISDSAGKKVVLKNILVGEVWMASGQSNMQWKAAACDVEQILKGIAERVKEGKEKPPVIREFEVTSVYSSLFPVEHATGEWKDGDLGSCSA
ncbi:MAG: hypothetical protein ACK5VX_10535, partial [Akkermansiaceae bacterium]